MTSVADYCIGVVYAPAAAAGIAGVAEARRFGNGTGRGCLLAADIAEPSVGWSAQRRNADCRSLTAGAGAGHRAAAGWNGSSAVGGREEDGEWFLVNRKHRDSCR